MRTFALLGVATLAISMTAPNTVWAWSSDQAVSQGTNTTNLADPEEALKALQDKVNANSAGSNTGFFVSGSVNQPPESSPYGYQSNPLGTPPTPYSFPTFRAR